MKSFLSLLLLAFSISASADVLSLYTDRPAATTKIIADAFKSKTGHDLDILEMSSADLVTRLQAEGAQTNGADVIFVKDLVYLNKLNGGGFFQPYSASNSQNINPVMKATNWVGVTYRARTVIYNTLSVDPSSLQNYEDLANSEVWGGRLCLRSSKSSYNEALVANLIADQGAQKAEQMLLGWIQNLATVPFADDNAVIKAVAEGSCDIGVVNTYYLGRAFSTDAQLPVGIVFMGQNTSGTHTNGSGVGISSATDKKDLANQLIEVMLSADVQAQIVGLTFEFPANTKTQHPNAKVGSWLGFKVNNTSWENLSPYIEQSVNLMKGVKYN